MEPHLEPQGILEISSFPVRHPLAGEDLLHTFGPRVVFRLSQDPTEQGIGILSREVQVDWVAKPGGGPSRSVVRSIGWSGVDDLLGRVPQVRITTAERTITEQAAIGVMALLMSDLESLVLVEVLPIGLGPDYLVKVKSADNYAIEVSGIRVAESVAVSRRRLNDKAEQLLRHLVSGYVSVTSFSHPIGGIVHSYSHFVSRTGGLSGKKEGGVPAEMTSTMDTTGIATRASLQGEAALGEGDTALATRQFTESGKLLKRRAAEFPDAHRKAVARYLAASQFFRGGNYVQAAKLSRRVKPEHLPDDQRPGFFEFSREALRRAAPDYLPSIRRVVANLWSNRRFPELLRVFQEHPYSLPAEGLSFIRAVACEELGHYQEAAAFIALAYRIDAKVEFATAVACELFKLANNGRLAEARKYADLLEKSLPHPVVLAGSAMVKFNEVNEKKSSPSDSAELIREFLCLFDQARMGFRSLSQAEKWDPEVCEIMSVAFGGATLIANKLGDVDLAYSISDEALQYWPNSVEVWSTRASIGYPDRISIEAAKRAAQLGAPNYSPYYFLSIDAYGTGDYHSALKWARDALAHLLPNQLAAARLHAWTAACVHMSGGSHAEAETLFQQALALNPADSELAEGYNAFVAQSRDSRLFFASLRMKPDEVRIRPSIPRQSAPSMEEWLGAA